MLHSGVTLTVVEDFSKFVYERVNSLRSNAIFGLILVLIILTLFLDKRIALWVSLTIPLSILGTFASALLGYDFTINVVSIFGIILVLGMLVDTGVVVAENIYRRYNEFGESPVGAARNGAAEVASPMIISLLTTATAFSLFFFLPGKPGSFFTEVSFVVVSALLAALMSTVSGALNSISTLTAYDLFNDTAVKRDSYEFGVAPSPESSFERFKGLTRSATSSETNDPFKVPVIPSKARMILSKAPVIFLKVPMILVKAPMILSNSRMIA
jgi:hypothetical protein